MPYNPDGSFSLTFTFGTGTAPNNQFPPQVGNALDDIASSIAISNLLAQFADSTVAPTFNSLVVGSPTGGNKGTGTVNAEDVYSNGVEVLTKGQSGAGQTLTGGINEVEFDNGTPTNGSTITIDPSNGLKQKITNNVAGFTINATSQMGDVELRIINGATAGTVTFSGFTKQWSGDSLDTTNGHQFAVFIYGFSGVTSYIIKALQ